MTLSDDQLQTLRHMLGIDDPQMREPKPYRDYYCANPGDQKMRALLDAGAVVMYRRDSYEWFTCTELGREAAIRSHKTIRAPKASRVYSRFLDVSDVCPDLTFKQFLTDPDFAETRRLA